MQDNLKLTVNVITYNHEKYIEECLNSILKQKTNFNFIIRIFDDASTDKTQEICRKYKERYPEKIELYFASKNLGMQNNVYINAIRSYKEIKTPYYIYIEGDDIFENKNRIQKQIEILDNNPNCSFCAMRTSLYFENQQSFQEAFPILSNGIYDLKNWIENPEKYLFSHISSRMVRTNCIQIDNDNPQYYIMDTTQLVLLMQQGKMFFYDKVGSCYNVTFEGSITSKNVLKKIEDICVFFKQFNQYTNFVYESILIHFLAHETSATVNFYNIRNFKCHLKKNKKIIFIIKNIKRYFIPRFILDIFDIPRNISRFIRRKLNKRGANESK